jgi:hypothetical protein
MTRQMPKGGRTHGARNRLSKEVADAILADWRAGGAAAIKITRLEKPDVYFKIVASLLPRELTFESVTSDLSDEQIDVLIEKIRDHFLRRQSETEIEIGDAVIH